MMKQNIKDLIGFGFYSYKYNSYTEQQSKLFFKSDKNKRTKKRKNLK